jgi:antitoxin component of RelBE/YafQ-DinJ toxin-antitoxin module
MSKHPTTIRLDRQLYKKAAQKAEKYGLTFSGVIHMLLQAFNEGSVQIGVTQYPEKYLKTLEKESAALSRLYKKGKVKGYASSKALFNDILGE